MTWTLAAFAILFLAIAGGFHWYERTRPSSKVLALVATLAALAALGRVAFAPIPNVKPTTDIVVLAGFALGAAPGFAVGAVAAVASNVFFGQGPWTPWQMVGWGLCGLLGALLARALRGREPSRLQLASTCAVAGAGFGLLLDLEGWLLYAPERSWAQFGLISGTSAWFNIAHIIGNVGFAVAFGPALLRMLARFRDRCEVRWEPLVATPALLLVVVAIAPSLAAPQRAAAAATPAARSLAFLKGAQNADGGYGAAKGQASNALYTGWALIGQGAARGGHCDTAAVRYVQRTVAGTKGSGDIERTILALRACRRGTGPLQKRLSALRRRDGSIAGLVNQTSFAILAWRAGDVRSSDARVRRAAAFVARNQNSDGGFSYNRKGGASGIDDTASAVQALIAAGRSRKAGPVARAVRHMRRGQNSDGGFGAAGGSSNAQSTSWAIQALLAAGVNPERVVRDGSRSASAYLRSLVASDGSVRYSRTSRQTPVWVTAQALTAFARRAFPIR